MSLFFIRGGGNLTLHGTERSGPPLVLSPGGTFEPPGELLEDTGYLLSWLGLSPAFDIEKEPGEADEQPGWKGWSKVSPACLWALAFLKLRKGELAESCRKKWVFCLLFVFGFWRGRISWGQRSDSQWGTVWEGWKREQRRKQRGKRLLAEAWEGAGGAVDGRVRGNGRDQGQGDHCGCPSHVTLGMRTLRVWEILAAAGSPSSCTCLTNAHHRSRGKATPGVMCASWEKWGAERNLSRCYCLFLSLSQ